MTIEAVFLVADILKDRAGKIAFVGYPTEGRAVRVGDKFVLRYEIHRTLDDVLNTRPMADPTDQKNVTLTIIAIDSMRKSVEQLPLGVTGALYLNGEGIEYVTKNSYLRTSKL